MSSRGTLIAAVGACLVAVLAAPAWGMGQVAGGDQDRKDTSDQTNASAPRDGTPKISTREADTSPESGSAPQRPERLGAVQEALRRLYAIPRAPGRDALRQPSPERGVARGTSDMPRRGADSAGADSNRLGLQHLDAIRNSRSSLPIGDDIRGAQSPTAAPGVTPDKGPAARGPIDPASVYVPGPYYDGYRPLGPRLSNTDREWTNYRYFGGRPGRYGYGMHDFGTDHAGDIYRFGFLEGFDRGRFEAQADERTEKILAHAGGHLSRGLSFFREGRYREAGQAFHLAAEANQGDPAARLYLTHAMFATGRYREAVRFLERAFELQPKIVFLSFDIRDDYGRRADFDKHLADLETAVQRAPRDFDRLLLLGYLYFYSNRAEDAYGALSKAHQVNRRDVLASRLMENAGPPDVELEGTPPLPPTR